MKKLLTIALMFLFVQAIIFGQAVKVLFFNDYHGMLREQKTSSSYNPGIIKFMGVIEDEILKSPDNTIVISGGDNYQGDFLSSMSYGTPVNEMFKDLHVVFSAIGNHEFDWSKDFSKQKPPLDKAAFFKKWENDGNFQFLAANIIDKNTNQPVSWAKPYAIVNINGLKIAFIGLSTKDTPITTSAENVADLEFTDAAIVAQKWIDYLNRGEAPEGKPDAIIALTHISSFQKNMEGPIEGDELKKLCTETKGLDAILSSHSHEFVSGQVNNIPVVQSGCFGRGLAICALNINSNNGNISIVPEVKKISPEMPIVPSKKGEEILKKYLETHKAYTEVIGFATDEFTREGVRFSSMGKFTVDSLRKAANVEITLNNKGGIRSDLAPGNIMIGDIKSIFPFSNTIVTLELKGSAVMEALKNPQTVSSGLIPVIKYHGDNYEVVGGVLSSGGKIDNNKFYTVSINDFMLGGGNDYKFPQYIKDGSAKNTVDTKKQFFDVIVDAIKEQKNITPKKGEYIVEEGFQIKTKPVKEKQVHEDAA